MDDQIATDQLLQRSDMHDDRDLGIGLEDVGIVTVSEDGMQATIALDHEEFARAHPNTTFHSEPTDEGEVSVLEKVYKNNWYSFTGGLIWKYGQKTYNLLLLH